MLSSLGFLEIIVIIIYFAISAIASAFIARKNGLPFNRWFIIGLVLPIPSALILSVFFHQGSYAQAILALFVAPLFAFISSRRKKNKDN